MKEPAFSLLEVVAAVAILGIGLVAAIALFTPVTKSVADVTDAEAAARVADAVRARLRALPFDQAAALIEDAATVRQHDLDGGYDPNDGTKHPQVLFGKAGGEIAVYDAPQKNWIDSAARVLAPADRFFEIDLIRNETLSPRTSDNDATAALLAYTMRVRWPAFVRTSPTTAVQNTQNVPGSAVTFDHSRKSVLFFNGAITR